MDVYASIARNLDPQARELLETFRTAKEPLPATITSLPCGFLFFSYMTPAGQPRFVLGDFGRKVANAAVALNEGEAA